MNNKRSNFTRIYFIGMAIIIIVMLYYAGSGLKSNNYKYNDLLNDLQNGKVTQLNISQNKEVPTGKVTVKLQDGSTKYVYITDVNQVISDIKDINDKTNQNIQPSIADVSRDSVFLTNILPMLLMGVVIVVVIMMMNANAAGGNSKMANFGKSRAKMVVEVKNMDFSKVAGLKEEKEELEEIVDFLKNPNKYIMLGARIPKGILLEGPPGTGKTLLAKATAGEAGVPFFTISGSDFVEMFVGVGASRVRDLFAQAKKNAPAIIFIDEIDAVGRKRGAGMGGGHDEREQTLNQLLVEMDGFSGNAGVIVIAATNRADVLDPALTRPGRFDRKILVGQPDVRGREAILKVHSKDKPMGPDVDLKEIAKQTPGFVGADLANLLNEAALLAARRDGKFITAADMDEAEDRVIAGPAKRNRVISKHEREVVANHEAGHTIVGLVLNDARVVHKVTIVPRGRAGGYAIVLPKEDQQLLSKKDALEQIAGMMGGRSAEEIVFNSESSGASNDFQQATQIARAMVTQYGMTDELGTVALEDPNTDPYAAPKYSQDTAAKIDAQVKRFTDEGHKKAREIIEEHRAQHKLIADALLKYETLDEKQILSLYNTGKMPEEQDEKPANEEETFDEAKKIAETKDSEQEEKLENKIKDDEHKDPKD